jgi:hypothetical protein
VAALRQRQHGGVTRAFGKSSVCAVAVRDVILLRSGGRDFARQGRRGTGIGFLELDSAALLPGSVSSEQIFGID